MPLNAPPRVSTKRQGVIATKVRAFVETALAENWSCAPVLPAASFSDWLGCQYSGVAQFFNGTTFSCALCAVNTMGRKTKKETAPHEFFE